MQLSRILVDVDATAGDHPAVAHAAVLAERSGARLTIVDVLPDVPAQARTYVTAAIERELVQHREELLAGMAHRLRGVRAATGVLRGQPAVALVQEVLRNGHDLLIRAHERHPGEGTRRPYGPTDTRLVRTCPCPLWLVGAATRRAPASIVAAVDLNLADPSSVALSQRIVEAAVTMHEHLGGRLTLVHAWSAFGESTLGRHLGRREIARAVEQRRAAASHDLRVFTESSDSRLSSAEQVLLHGEPERVIPDFMRRRRAALVVMGTVARSGPGAFLIGNTAERMLADPHGSVLIVKPPWFQCPIPAPPAARSRPSAARSRRQA